jgi:DNA-binding LacI/PurR family transcriptional regulator
MTQKTVRNIADIARLAGVSKSTVSRALSDSPLISQETRERIQAIANQHGFQVSSAARSLSTQRSQTLGFVTHGAHSLPGTPSARADFCEFSMDDLFSLEILGAISTATTARDYDLLLVHVNPRDSKWAAKYLHTGRVDGFILMTSSYKQTHIKSMLEIQAPFIAWGVPGHEESYCSVSGDNVRGGRLATSHLIEKGCKRIGFIGGPSMEKEVQQRYLGYQQALEANSMAVDPKLVEHGNFSTTSGGEAVRRLLQEAPDLDAVFVNSDLMAIGAMEALTALGKQIPQDVAVVGYDDVSIAAHGSPPLTTIRQNIPEIGRVLVNNLIQYIENGFVANVTMPVELVERASTQK